MLRMRLCQRTMVVHSKEDDSSFVFSGDPLVLRRGCHCGGVRLYLVRPLPLRLRYSLRLRLHRLLGPDN